MESYIIPKHICLARATPDLPPSSYLHKTSSLCWEYLGWGCSPPGWAEPGPHLSVPVDPHCSQPFLRQQEHLSAGLVCFCAHSTILFYPWTQWDKILHEKKAYLGCFQDVYSSDACVVSSTERIRINAFLVDTVLIFQAKLRSRTPVSAAVCLLSSWILCTAVSAVCGVLSFQLALFPVGWKVGACLRKRISTPAYFDGNKKI